MFLHLMVKNVIYVVVTLMSQLILLGNKDEVVNAHQKHHQKKLVELRFCTLMMKRSIDTIEKLY